MLPTKCAITIPNYTLSTFSLLVYFGFLRSNDAVSNKNNEKEVEIERHFQYIWKLEFQRKIIYFLTTKFSIFFLSFFYRLVSFSISEYSFRSNIMLQNPFPFVSVHAIYSPSLFLSKHIHTSKSFSHLDLISFPLQNFYSFSVEKFLLNDFRKSIAKRAKGVNHQ